MRILHSKAEPGRPKACLHAPRSLFARERRQHPGRLMPVRMRDRVYALAIDLSLRLHHMPPTSTETTDMKL